LGNEDGGKELPQRLRGAARAGSASVASPVVTEDMRKRMQAAVKAERAQAAERDREPTEAIRRAADSEPANGGLTTTANEAKRAIKPQPAGQPQPAGEVPGNHTPAAAVQDRAEWQQPGVQKPGRRRFVTARRVTSVLVLIAAGSLAIAVTRYVTSWPAGHRAPGVSLQPQDARARDQAASWVAQQVSHSAVVSCDKTMCAALEAHGFPSHNLLVLGPTANYPVTSAVVAVTPTVRSWFGSILSSELAPAVIATFGSGDAAITIRVMAPQGAAAYRAALGADLAARKATGADLVQVPGITVSATARQQLIAGQADSRLLLAIAALASNEPIDILQFGSTGPGADADMPLRFADLAQNDQAAHMTSSAYVRSIRTDLGAVALRFRPASIETVMLPTGQAVLRIEFTAPSPLGLLGPQGSH
jgi:hypothetical protein